MAVYSTWKLSYSFQNNPDPDFTKDIILLIQNSLKI